nr:unnamed protein product [Spirometra erinaceieuropaei]
MARQSSISGWTGVGNPPAKAPTPDAHACTVVAIDLRRALSIWSPLWSPLFLFDPSYFSTQCPHQTHTTPAIALVCFPHPDRDFLEEKPASNRDGGGGGGGGGGGDRKSTCADDSHSPRHRATIGLCGFLL